MGGTDDVGARVLGVLKGIAGLLFAIQLTVLGTVDGGLFLWLVAGLLVGVVSVAAAVLSCAAVDRAVIRLAAQLLVTGRDR